MKENLKIYGRLFKLGFFRMTVGVLFLFPSASIMGLIVMSILFFKGQKPIGGDIHSFFDVLPIIMSYFSLLISVESIGNKKYQFLTALPIKPKNILAVFYTNIIVYNLLMTIIILFYDCFETGFDFTLYQIISLLLRLIIIFLFVPSFTTRQFKFEPNQTQGIGIAVLASVGGAGLFVYILRYIFFETADGHYLSNPQYLTYTLPVALTLGFIIIILIQYTFKKSLIKIKE